MIPILDAVVTLGSLIVPPVFDFIKKKFIKSEGDTPERTMGNLATTKPEVLPEYTNALANFYKAQVDFFNRDVVGTPSLWVVNLRASIRPVTVILSIVLIFMDGFEFIKLPAGAILTFEAVIASWMGSRFTLNGK